MNQALYIGSRRELLWDDTLIDTEQSNTVAELHHPVQRECVLSFSQPWVRKDGAYKCVLTDGDLHRMYTCLAGKIFYAESRDGIHWEQPNLGLVECDGSTDNSLVKFEFLPDFEPAGFDGFRVFVDENPACLPEERYKAIGDMYGKLQIYVSADGLSFRHVGHLPLRAQHPFTPFDSINTLFFDKNTGKYKAFVRDFYAAPNPAEPNWVRAISVTESAELFPKEGWPQAKFLQYSNPNPWQMYINSIFPYPRAQHVYVGFPSRYVWRTEWTPNFDELCGAEARRKRAGADGTDRHGISLSDTLFMTSRDGRFWTRYPEAFLRPGPEHPTNWVYGSVYFSNGLVETEASHPGCDKELSFYCVENRFFDVPPQIYRYSIRMDGFVSQTAPYPEAFLVTKPFIFEGSDLFINFSTSAFGHMIFTITDEEGNSISSDETFGDSTDRRVRFAGDLSAFAGKPVVLRVKMMEADFYSFQFRNP